MSKYYPFAEKCPITGRRYFMSIPDVDGKNVETYGGPFDSFTFPQLDSVGDLVVQRYDHDEGGWIDGYETILHIPELIHEYNLFKEELNMLKKENKRLKDWINDLQSGMYINCVYCGHRYGPKDEVPSSIADVLKEHIETCPEHPLSKVKTENTKLKAKIKIVVDSLLIILQWTMNDAWLYGTVTGWNDSFDEVAHKHGLTDTEIKVIREAREFTYGMIRSGHELLLKISNEKL